MHEIIISRHNHIYYLAYIKLISFFAHTANEAIFES